MKARIISDTHTNINNKIELLNYNDDIFTIIAGDISDSAKREIEWLNKNIRNGLYVCGNHIVYKKENRCLSLQAKRKFLENTHKLTDNLSFLHNNYKEIDDKIFIGTTLFTNYEYPCPPYYNTQRDNLYEASKDLHDFKFGLYNKEGKLVRLHPSHYLIEFNICFNYLKKIVKQFKDKECIIITHHAPSSQSIEEDYLGDKLNASYVSELENFILDNPNITHWIHGHLHCQCDYKIGNTRIICNARGYLKYDHTNFNKNFTIEI